MDPSRRPLQNHLAHPLPLAPLPRSIIAAQPVIDGSDFVFTSDGCRPLTSFSRNKAELDARMPGVPAFTLHDLRRTAASGMMRLGIRTEVIERALNHRSGSFRGIIGVYQTDPLTTEVCNALERWSQHIEGLLSPAQNRVVPWRAR